MKNRTLSNFSLREFELVTLPLADGVTIKSAEQLIIQFDEKSFDVGALCYRVRSNQNRSGKYSPRLVDQSTLIEENKAKIVRLVNVLSGIAKVKRPASLEALTLAFVQLIDFSDNHFGKNCLSTNEELKDGFYAYYSYLIERYRLGPPEGLAGSSVNHKHTQALEILRAYLDDESFAIEIPLLQGIQQQETIPASTQNYARTLALAEAVFIGLSDLLLNNRAFPFKFELPDYLNWKTGNHLWLFPANKWFMTPPEWGESRKLLVMPFCAYDYANGVLNSSEQIFQFNRDKPTYRRSQANRTHLLAQRLIDTANSDVRHYKRILLAKAAHNAFLFLFLANTAINLSVLQSIEFDGDEVSSEVLTQNFRGIKYRANHKEITVVVPTSFLPLLKTFLKLRSFALGGRQFPLMFFADASRTKKTISKANEDQFNMLFSLLQAIDPNIIPIKTRQIRATANDFLLRNFDVKTTATVMGHSVETERRKYGRGSPTEHYEEMTNCLNKISAIAKKQKITKDRNSLNNASLLELGGACESFGNPISLSSEPSLKPFCNGGCYFCVNRCLVADEADVRKIASAMFVMQRAITSLDQEILLRPLIQKCDEDLNAISKINGHHLMVDKVKKEVFNVGDLTPYWAAKYQHLNELGAIT